MKASRTPNHYIFITSDADKSRMSRPSAASLAKYRLSRCEWGFGVRTKNRKAITIGDRVLVYLSGKRENGSHFVAECTVASDVHQVSNSFSQTVDAPDRLGNAPAAYSVSLKAVRYFQVPVPIKALKRKLSFIKQPESKKWGAFLQGGALLISPKDFHTILDKS